MARSPRQYVFEAMELLPDALTPFVERRLEDTFLEPWRDVAFNRIKGLYRDSKGNPAWDQAALLKAIAFLWHEAFESVLTRAERSIANELIDIRNRLAHGAPFNWDDTERALDSMRRLTAKAGAGDAARRIGEMRDAVLRSKYAAPAPAPAGEHDTALRPAVPPRDASHRPRKFTQEEFANELNRILDEERTAGRNTCRVVAHDLHRRVVGGSQPNRMVMACNAMWKLWERQGSRPDRIIRTTPSGRSTTIEIEYRL